MMHDATRDRRPPWPIRKSASAAHSHELTEREREVLALVADGLSNPAIASALDVSVHTVRNHIANLCTKLGAHSKLEALAVAIHLRAPRPLRLPRRLVVRH